MSNLSENQKQPECPTCGGLGYYETWKYDYGSQTRKHKCPCKIPNYIYPSCSLLGIKGGDPMSLWEIGIDDEKLTPKTKCVCGFCDGTDCCGY